MKYLGYLGKALLWILGLAVSWICAAFIHLVDAEMSGFQSLSAPNVLASISLSALVVLIPAAICCAVYNRGSWRAFFVSVSAFAVCLGTVLMLLGFGGNSVGSWLVGFASSVAIFGVVLVSASLPLVLSGRIRIEVSGMHT